MEETDAPDSNKVTNKDILLFDDARYPKALQVEKLYKKMSQIGITYGPTFSTLEEIHYNDGGEVIAKLDLEAWKQQLEEAPRDLPNILHPAALDALLQISFPAVSKGLEVETQPFVPTFIKDMWISANVPDQQLVKVYAKSKRTGPRFVNTQSVALDAVTGQRRIWCSFEGTIIENEVQDSSTKVAEDSIVFGNRWQPDISLMQPAQISEYCNSFSIDEDRLVGRREFNAVEEAKELYCLARLYQVNQGFQPNRQPQEMTKLIKYAEWIKIHLSKEFLGSVTLEQLDELANNAEALKKLEDAVLSHDPLGKVLVVVGRSIEKLIYGETDAVELLFQDPTLLNKVYAFTTGIGTGYSRVRTWLQLWTHKNAGLRILEIGAGTGSTTRELICPQKDGKGPRNEAMMFQEYVFTDISSSFFEAAREEFKDLEDRMRYATLDVTVDPVKQGFEAGSYDLVVASNVIHATPDLFATLSNVNKLLKPGGVFILHEITEVENVTSGFIYGFLDGWWLAKEPLRRLGPLMVEEDWDRFLRNAGFLGIENSFVDDLSGIENTMMIARKPFVTEEVKPTPSSFYIVLDDNSELQQTLAKRLKNETTTFKESTIVSVSDIERVGLNAASVLFLPEIEHPFLYGLSEKDFSKLHNLVTASDRLLWIKINKHDLEHDAAMGIVDGLRISIERERPAMRWATLTLDTDQSFPTYITQICQIFEHICRSSEEYPAMDSVFKVVDNIMNISRIVPLDETTQEIVGGQSNTTDKLQSTAFKAGHDRALKLIQGSPGVLESFYFVDDEDVRSEYLLPSEIEVEVVATSLNFRDVSVITGNSRNFHLGYDCAGFVRRAGTDTPFQPGDRVMALSQKGSLRTLARCDWRCAATISDDIQLQDAAAIPTVFLTAWACLQKHAQMQDGQSILVHSAAGGVGQAVIQLVKHLYPKAKILATVGTLEKKTFLMENYGLADTQIFYNRDHLFADGVRDLTKGDGVDVIINSLSGEGLRKSWEIVAPFGKFVHIGNSENEVIRSLPMEPFARGASFTAFDLLQLATSRPGDIFNMFASLTPLLLNGKIAAPKPYEIMPVSRLGEAFDKLRSGKVVGKIGIAMESDDVVQATPASVLVETEFNPEATYLIAGGLGGLAQKLAVWMVGRGAKNLILLGRSGEDKDKASKDFVQKLRGKGVNVAAPPCDVGNRDTLQHVLSECARTMPPIRGCVQGAMAVAFGPWADMDYPKYRDVMGSKVAGTWNLHTLLPSKLDFFIMLSTVMSVIGGHGQTLYTAGCGFQDEITQQLVQTGIRPETSSINLSIVEDAGYTFDNGLIDVIARRGFAATSLAQLYRLIDLGCSPARQTGKHPAHTQVITGVHSPAWLRANDIEVPHWLYAPLFTRIYHSRNTNAVALQGGDEADFEARLSAADSPDDMALILIDGIRLKLSKMLAIDVQEIDAERPAYAYGIDSLGAVELRSWIQRHLGCRVTTGDLTGDRSIQKLGKDFVSLCQFAKVGVRTA